MDQQLESLPVIRRLYKWYKKIVSKNHDAILSEFPQIIPTEWRPEWFLKYLHDVVTQLLTYSPHLNLTTKSLNGIARLTGHNHFPSKRAYEGDGRKWSSKKKVCRVCYACGVCTPKGAYVESTWVCKTCPTVPGLCADKSCFRDYHIKLDYCWIPPMHFTSANCFSQQKCKKNLHFSLNEELKNFSPPAIQPTAPFGQFILWQSPTDGTFQLVIHLNFTLMKPWSICALAEYQLFFCGHLLLSNSGWTIESLAVLRLVADFFLCILYIGLRFLCFVFCNL